MNLETNKDTYQHIIWDWNGTLLDDVKDCVASVNKLLHERDLPMLTAETYRESVDFPIIDFYVRLGFDFEVDCYDQVSEEYNNLYLDLLEEFRLREGARETLAMLSERGFSHSVLSAYHQERLDLVIDHFGLRKWFIKLIGTSDYYAHGKIEYGKEWIQELPHDNEHVLFIGDMKHDYDVAQAMNVDCVLLTYGHQSREQLQPLGVPLFDSLGEITAWLLGDGD